jgi:hypothetical protein
VNSRKGAPVRFNSAAAALLTFVVLVAGGASAKDRKPKESNNQAHVVGHISFEGISSVDMVIQRKLNDTYYLYVQHAKDQGISVIDISKPTEPKAVGLIPWPDSVLSGRMNVTGDLAIIAETGVPPMRNITSNDLVLWDLSNPGAPRVVQKFSGVAKWLQDDRDFVYILNGEGLWVVSKPADRRESESSESFGG